MLREAKLYISKSIISSPKIETNVPPPPSSFKWRTPKVQLIWLLLENWLSMQPVVQNRCSYGGVGSAQLLPQSPLTPSMQVPGPGWAWLLLCMGEVSSPVSRTLGVTGAKQGHALPLPVSCCGWAKASHKNLRMWHICLYVSHGRTPGCQDTGS